MSFSQTAVVFGIGGTGASGAAAVCMFEEAFHDEAWIFFTEADGSPRASRLSTEFSGWAATHDPIDGVWKITNKTATRISRAGDVPRI